MLYLCQTKGKEGYIMPTIHVAAGLIWRRGRVLICKRGPSKAHSHLWEFPGGKLEEGENALQCLVRELKEELGITVAPDCEIAQGTDTLPDGRQLQFHFVQGYLPEGEPQCTEHEALCWARPQALEQFRFCPAEEKLAAKLAKEPFIDHFFWDFDGTLMDTYPTMSLGFQKALAALGHEVPLEEVLKAVKVSVGAACRKYGELFNLKQEDLMAQYRHFESQLTPDAQPYPGMAETLALGKRYHIGQHLYTHRSRNAVTYLEKHLDASILGEVVTSEDGYPIKPAPDALNAMADRLKVSPANCLMVGDRDIDVQAGLNAGMQGCLFDPDGHYDAFDAPNRVRSFRMFRERFIP